MESHSKLTWHRSRRTHSQSPYKYIVSFLAWHANSRNWCEAFWADAVNLEGVSVLIALRFHGVVFSQLSHLFCMFYKSSGNLCTSGENAKSTTHIEVGFRGYPSGFENDENELRSKDRTDSGTRASQSNSQSKFSKIEDQPEPPKTREALSRRVSST